MKEVVRLTNNGDKCIVYSQWVKFLEILRQQLVERNIGYRVTR